jgi:hypothetical protein
MRYEAFWVVWDWDQGKGALGIPEFITQSIHLRVQEALCGYQTTYACDLHLRKVSTQSHNHIIGLAHVHYVDDISALLLTLLDLVYLYGLTKALIWHVAKNMGRKVYKKV